MGIIFCGVVLHISDNDGNINAILNWNFMPKSEDFYMKDCGYSLPSMLYAVANLGKRIL